MIIAENAVFTKPWGCIFDRMQCTVCGKSTSGLSIKSHFPTHTRSLVGFFSVLINIKYVNTVYSCMHPCIIHEHIVKISVFSINGEKVLI